MNTKICWCRECKVPVIIREEAEERVCPSCGTKLKLLSKDIRPVFPEERFLLEILKNQPGAFTTASVWANRNTYFIDGKSMTLPDEAFKQADIEKIRQAVVGFVPDYEVFNRQTEQYIKANIAHLEEIAGEAVGYIRQQASEAINRFVSFSGGKDSTCVSNLVMEALGTDVNHIHIDTSIELDQTMEHLEEFRQYYPEVPFFSARNEEQDFYKVAEDIGPPAMHMRWCCYMFKTGIIDRVFKDLYGGKKVLTFYGVRKHESSSRKKYNRTEERSEAVKVACSRMAAPIIDWKDCDVWLYILGRKIPFNKAYRQGYNRVGCYLCPNSNKRSFFLTKLYMPEKSKNWRDLIVRFAEKTGRNDPKSYADDGAWRFRLGGNGLSAAKDVRVRETNCTTQENAKVFELNKEITDCFYNLFVPIGKLSKGRSLIGEVLVSDRESSMPILSIQPFQSEFENSVKVVFLTPGIKLQRQVTYQIRKFNACRKCLKCESLCRFQAIKIDKDGYRIVADKCKSCKMCVTAKYLRGGCLMAGYLRTKLGSD